MISNLCYFLSIFCICFSIFLKTVVMPNFLWSLEVIFFEVGGVDHLSYCVVVSVGNSDQVMRYELGQNAYIKLVLHALKHCTSPVNGVLVGRCTGNSGAEVVEVTDAVPLFHSVNQISLLPSLEIALLQIEEHYSSQGLSLVGYFHANDRYDDCELSNLAKNIGDHIYRYFPQAAILLLDNKRLEALSKTKDQSPVMQLYTRDASKNWKLVVSEGRDGLCTREPASNVVLSDYMSSKKWEGLIDFGDHLDDISKDWLNADLFK